MFCTFRLSWLENTFLGYVNHWKKTAPSVNSFLTPETHEALAVTTLSTVLCTRHLLDQGFKYVLTFKFSSDRVESLFSAVRQLNGSNDRTDAYGALSSLHKILVTGIVKPSPHANTQDSEFEIGALLQKPALKPAASPQNLDKILRPFLKELQMFPGKEPFYW